MTDRKIITDNELNYIETLYLYCNLEDFINTVKLDNYDISENITSSRAYDIYMDYYSQLLTDKAEFIGTAKGRDWYRFNNYRVGIMPYDRAKLANQFNCVIQYEQYYMFTLDSDLKNIVLPFEQDFSKYHIKRIDITKIAKHKEDYTVGYGYISPFRRDDRVNGTIYLGNRQNGNVFRMYNKTKELLTNTKEHPINHTKINLFSKYFGDIENLYTYELELSRAYLKNTLGIDTLNDLSKVFDAYLNIVGSIRFYKDNDKNKRLVKSNNREKISCKKLTDFKDYERLEKKRYKPSFDYALADIVNTVDRYVDSVGDRTNEEYMKFINALLASRINQDNKDLVITFENTIIGDDIDDMRAKHKLMIHNQSNELEIEAKRIFG